MTATRSDGVLGVVVVMDGLRLWGDAKVRERFVRLPVQLETSSGARAGIGFSGSEVLQICGG